MKSQYMVKRRKAHVGRDCVACGKCAKACPADDIKIVKKGVAKI